MKYLYLFNPENDMALANFTPYYKTTSEIIRMADELSFLPAWYATEGSIIKIAAKQRLELFRLQCQQVGIIPNVEWTTDYLSMPYRVWGWNPALLYSLRQAGVAEDFLLTDEEMAKLRYLSSRQRCKEVLTYFDHLPYVCGMSQACGSLEDVRSFIEVRGETVLKAPWSGSGRGLVHVTPNHWSSSVEGWITRIIRTQGAVIAEPYYNKVIDFAMEFSAAPEISFAGYSLFETDMHGNYKGNLLLSNEDIEKRLVRYIPQKLLHEVCNRLIEALSVLLKKDYCGYLGVDMMICKEEESFLIYPCVEINLRMNMGIASRIIYDRYVHPYSQGYYAVEHYSEKGAAMQFHKEMTACHPLDIENGFIRHGYLSLTPVLDDSHYQVYILID